MKKYEREALAAVYEALDELPSGYGGGATTTSRALSIGAQCLAKVRGPALLLLEVLVHPAGTREEVEERKRLLVEASAEALEIGE